MFKPLNRHVHIELIAENTHKPDTGILLPEDFKPAENRHAMATVITASEDVKFRHLIEKSTRIVVDKAMVEKINFGDESINVILENYILGIIS